MLQENTMRILLVLTLALAFSQAADKRSFTLNAANVKWEPINPPGAPPGLMQKLLHDNKQNHFTSAIVRFPKGYREPRHYHTMCGHTIYILKGKLRSPEGMMTPGTFNYAAVTERHGPFVAEEETEFLFYTDGPFDYLVDDTKK